MSTKPCGVGAFLRQYLESPQYSHLLEWVDQERGHFRILWLHAGRANFDKEYHQALFYAYRSYKGLPIGDDAKQSFGMALKKSPAVQALRNYPEDDWRYYVFNPDVRCMTRHCCTPGLQNTPFSPPLTPSNYHHTYGDIQQYENEAKPVLLEPVIKSEFDPVNSPWYHYDPNTPSPHTSATFSPPPHTSVALSPPPHTSAAFSPPPHTSVAFSPPPHTPRVLTPIGPPPHTPPAFYPPPHTPGVFFPIGPPPHTPPAFYPPPHTPGVLSPIGPSPHTPPAFYPQPHTPGVLSPTGPPPHTPPAFYPPPHTPSTLSDPSQTPTSFTPTQHTVASASTTQIPTTSRNNSSYPIPRTQPIQNVAMGNSVPESMANASCNILASQNTNGVVPSLSMIPCSVDTYNSAGRSVDNTNGHIPEDLVHLQVGQGGALWPHVPTDTHPPDKHTSAPQHTAGRQKPQVFTFQPSQYTLDSNQQLYESLRAIHAYEQGPINDQKLIQGPSESLSTPHGLNSLPHGDINNNNLHNSLPHGDINNNNLHNSLPHGDINNNNLHNSLPHGDINNNNLHNSLPHGDINNNNLHNSLPHGDINNNNLHNSLPHGDINNNNLHNSLPHGDINNNLQTYQYLENNFQIPQDSEVLAVLQWEI